MKKILALVNDLIFRSRIDSMLKGKGLEIKFVGSLKEINTEFDQIIVDISEKEALDVIEKFPDESVCFGSHKDVEKFKKARELGCRSVFPRSIFFQKLNQLI